MYIVFETQITCVTHLYHKKITRIPTLKCTFDNYKILNSRFALEHRYILTNDEGGRHKPFFSNYRPQFFIRTGDVTGQVTLPEGTEMVMPGDNSTLTVELISPTVIEPGLEFAMREGGNTVGAGKVVKIIE